MKIKMLTTMAGPHGCANEGQVLELDEHSALHLIENGYAEPHKDEKSLDAKRAHKKGQALKQAILQAILDKAAAADANILKPDDSDDDADTLLPLEALTLDELPEEVRAAIRDKIESGEIDPLNLPEGHTLVLPDALVDNLLIVEEAQEMAEEKAASQTKDNAETQNPETDPDAAKAAEANEVATEASAKSTGKGKGKGAK